MADHLSQSGDKTKAVAEFRKALALLATDESLAPEERDKFRELLEQRLH